MRNGTKRKQGTDITPADIFMKADKTTLKQFYTEQIAFYVVPQTRDVFITAINICQLHISLANNAYCTVLVFQLIPATEIVGSNPTGGMDVCPLCCVL